jgi:hypothetical protein
LFSYLIPPWYTPLLNIIWIQKKPLGLPSEDAQLHKRHILRDRRSSTAAWRSLLGNGGKGIEIVYGEGKKYSALGRLEQPRQNKNLLYQQDQTNEPTKEEALF